ncbi:hypothetical protein ATCC90586_004231 [Pythium insidiosum]|nr:hypothetical protein ATCC90586_004231 [Pythium insidiosum]
MVGFLRKKKSDKVMLGDETALDRKGRVDGSSLLDDNGDPTEDTLYNQKKGVKKNGKGKNGEDEASPQGYPPNNNYPPATYPYGQTYPPQQGAGFPQNNQYPHSNGGMSHGYGNTNGFGNNAGNAFPQQPQYPVQYGNYPPPAPEAPKKSSFFRIPGMSRKK